MRSALLFLSAVALAQTQPAPEPFAQVKAMGRGVNIVGYDALWQDPAKARFQAKHFRALSEAGFQHVRVNLHAFRHLDAQGRLKPEWFRTMDWIIDQALENKLAVILDEHDFNYCGEDPAGCKTKLISFWTQVAARYKDAPGDVLFEILNEPNSKYTPELWNRDLKELLALIRQTNPTRNVVIGAAFWSNLEYVKRLELPEEDRHLIATVHYYLPMRFTHQGAPWSKENEKLSGVEWGSEADRAQLERYFGLVQEWSLEKRRPILLGEFGAYDKAPMESRARYTSAVARAAEARGWAWSYWQFDSDFLLWDMQKDAFAEPIRRALIP